VPIPTGVFVKACRCYEAGTSLPHADAPCCSLQCSKSRRGNLFQIFVVDCER